MFCHGKAAGAATKGWRRVKQESISDGDQRGTMKDTHFIVVLAVTAAVSASAYDINLEPDAAKRRTVTILEFQGPKTAALHLKGSPG